MRPVSADRDVTDLLASWGRGDRQALDLLIPRVHDELRKLGRSHLARERPDHTLQPTALVHETYLALLGQRRPPADCRRQFFGVASLLMRRILLRHEERRRAVRHGGDATVVAADFETELLVDDGSRDEFLALTDALETLRSVDPRQASVVTLRFFAGFTVAETSARLGISVATVNREWRMARAWLRAAVLGSSQAWSSSCTTSSRATVLKSRGLIATEGSRPVAEPVQ